MQRGPFDFFRPGLDAQGYRRPGNPYSFPEYQISNYYFNSEAWTDSPVVDEVKEANLDPQGTDKGQDGQDLVGDYGNEEYS